MLVAPPTDAIVTPAPPVALVVAPAPVVVVPGLAVLPWFVLLPAVVEWASLPATDGPLSDEQATTRQATLTDDHAETLVRIARAY